MLWSALSTVLLRVERAPFRRILNFHPDEFSSRRILCKPSCVDATAEFFSDFFHLQQITWTISGKSLRRIRPRHQHKKAYTKFVGTKKIRPNEWCQFFATYSIASNWLLSKRTLQWQTVKFTVCHCNVRLDSGQVLAMEYVAKIDVVRSSWWKNSSEWQSRRILCKPSCVDAAANFFSDFFHLQ